MTLILINPLNEVSSNTSLYLVQTAFPGREETLESNWRAERRSCPSCPRLCPAGMVVVGRSSFLPCHHVHCEAGATSHLKAGREEKLSRCGLSLQGAACCHLPNGCRHENGRRVASLSWQPALQPWLKKKVEMADDQNELVSVCNR